MTAPNDIVTLAKQDAGARSKYLLPAHRPDGRANIQMKVSDMHALQAAGNLIKNARMLVLCRGGGGWSDGMRGIAVTKVGGAIDFCDQIAEAYGHNFDHPVAVADILEVELTVRLVKKWEQASGKL